MSSFRCDVADPALVPRLVGDAPPLGLRAAGAPARSFHRDLYLDTTDGALRRRGAVCRLRLRADDRRVLTLSVRRPDGGLDGFEASVAAVDPRQALVSDVEPARRLRGLVDPAQLKPRVELEVERVSRAFQGGLVLGSRFEAAIDTASVRAGGLVRDFRELKVTRLRAGRPTLGDLERVYRETYGLRLTLTPKLERAEALLGAIESEARARSVGTGRAIVLLALDGGRLALRPIETGLVLPSADGSGEEGCHHLLRQVLGSAVGDLKLLGTVPAVGRRPLLEVWLAERVRPVSAEAVTWLPYDEALARAGSPALRDPDTLAALTLATRTDGPVAVPPVRSGSVERSRRELTLLPAPVLPKTALDTRHADPEQLLEPELSLVEFNARVLALGEDASVPALARLLFLSIVSSNLDELAMVQIGELKELERTAAKEPSGGGLGVDQRLSILSIRLRQLMSRQESALRGVLRTLSGEGIRVASWDELSPVERAAASKLFRERVFPALTPRALTVSPGHPFPLPPNLTLSFALILEDTGTGPAHFGQLRIPSAVPRFLTLEEGRLYVPLEDVVRAHLGDLYPGRRVASAFLFRVTRRGDLELDEEGAGNLLQAVEEDARNRARNAVVRVEVERGLPRPLLEMLRKELELERGAGTLPDRDFHEVPGRLDVGGFREIAFLPAPALQFPAFTARDPLPAGRSLWDLLRDGDRLAHHPYEAFGATTQRFFEAAAADPAVVSIKSTLYRAGDRSPVVTALLSAARAGKEVAVFVELKARFDEERNVTWARTLEEAGIQVIHGLVGLKNHAKVALVARREGETLARYAHIGTGNYNASTARLYTDLSLLTADEVLTADVNDLFNELTGSSRAPRAPFRRLLVAPNGLLPGILSRIEREAEHARAGRPSGIAIKVNGLADAEVVRALYRASQAGVDVRLVVRGICTLRPGVPGLSERIGVVSSVGRFLEHARILRFENGGSPERFLGSADLRPRNLRRRVEVLAPVDDPGLAARLDRILEVEWSDPRAWELSPYGAYVRRAGTGPSAQDAFLSGT